MPAWFPPTADHTHCPTLHLLSIPDGAVFWLGRAPLVLAGDGRIVEEGSSRYARLVHFLPQDLRPHLDAAVNVPGPLFVLGDDTWPPNYCHWLLDTLPRLAALHEAGRQDEVFVAVPTLTEPYQRETLHLCGIDDARIVEVAPMQAVRARARSW